ncbi:MAG: TRAP transporter substrate-binding protein DctP [Desulfobacteraceae bacterium]
MKTQSVVWTMTLLLCGAIFFASTPVAAESPVTLKVATFLPKNDRHLDYFWKFVDRLEKQSDGRIAVRVVGGPEAIPSFEQIQAVRTGVVDLVATCSAYYVGDLKEALAFQYGNITPQEERSVGFYEFMDEIHQEKLGLKYLGRFSYPGRFYFFSNEPLRSMADFEGKRIRSNPGYEPFVKAMGATPVNTSFSEVFSVMERGVVDAFAWPIPGPLFYGWESVFDYVILPGFYEMNTVMHMNLKTWNKLSQDLQKVVMDNVTWMEKEIVPYYRKFEKDQLDKMQDMGKTLITVEDPEAYLKLSMDEAWEMVREACPESGSKMESMIRK